MRTFTALRRTALGLLPAVLISGTAFADFKVGDPTILTSVEYAGAPETPFRTGSCILGAADLNDDGFDDLVALFNGGGYVALGSASHALGQQLPIAHKLSVDSSGNAQFADFDRDGDLDVFVQDAFIFLNDGSGHLTGPTQLPGLGASVQVVDMNADTFADLVSVGPTSVEIRFSTGPIAFGPPTAVPELTTLTGVATISDDSVPDIVGADKVLVSTLLPGVGTTAPISGPFTTLVDVDANGRFEGIRGRMPTFSSDLARLEIYEFNGSAFILRQSLSVPIAIVTTLNAGTLDVQALDYDHDDDTDLAVTVRQPPFDEGSSNPLIPINSLLVKNDGSGMYTDDATVACGGLRPNVIVSGQFDADPGDDIVFANYGIPSTSQLEPDSRIFGRSIALVHTDEFPFATPWALTRGNIGSSARDAIVHDVNADAIPDLVFSRGEQLSLLLGIATGVFRDLPVLPQTLFVPYLILGDADDDGNLDALCNIGGTNGFSRISVEPSPGPQGEAYVPHTAIVRSALTTASTFSIPGNRVAADLDADGDTDYFQRGTPLLNSHRTQLLVGLRDGSTYQTESIVVPGLVFRLDGINANDDEALDAITYKAGDSPTPGRYLNYQVQLWLNDGAGHLANPILLHLTPEPIIGMSVGDFGGDARDDFLITTDSGDIRVFLQTDAGFTDPVVTSLAPFVMAQPVIADFDLDGELDIAAPVRDPSFVGPNFYNDWSDRSLFLFGNGLGSFPRRVESAYHAGPAHEGDTFDFNFDGRPDYVAYHAFGGITLYPNLSTPTNCPADANGDLLIDGRDLSLLLSTFGDTSVKGRGADLNSDGVIDGVDLGVLLSQYGTACQ